MNIDEQIIHTTIRIISLRADGLTSTGTGFFYRYDIANKQVPVIVTNKHVVKDSVKLVLKFSVASNDSFVQGDSQTINMDNPKGLLINHPDDNVDLCLIKIAPILNLKLQKKMHIVFLTKENVITDEYISNNISNIENITTIGYPNGIIDEYNNLPIVRRGITATSLKYDFNNNKEFLIDSAIYNGSSGSPVFIFNQGSYSIGNSLYAGDRCLLVGIVYAVMLHTVNGELKIKEVPVTSVPVAESRIPNNLGVVIKACKLFDFENIIDEILKAEETVKLS